MKSSITAFLLWLPLAAGAQVYRCTGPNGQVQYSDAPCAGGTVIAPQAAADNNSTRALQSENQRLREQLLRQENQRLRDRLQRSETAAPAAAPPAHGRSAADLQGDRADSYECRSARRDYEVTLSSVTGRNKADAARAAMYSACGMRPPNRTTTRVEKPRNSNCVRSGNIIHCS